MRRFLAGLVTGAVIVLLAWALMSREDPDETPTVAAPTVAAAPVPPRPQPPEPARPPSPRHTDGPANVPPGGDVNAPFPPGEAVLHAGEGYVFGETAARPRGSADGADIVCLDIGPRITLHGPFGARLADVPLGAVGIPTEPRGAAALVADAPTDLAPGDADVEREAAPGRPGGVALIRSKAAVAYRVFVISVVEDKDALRRSVRLGWGEVPQRAGGGVVAAPSTKSAAGAPTLADLEKIMAAGASLPGSDFTNFLSGTYERLSTMPADLVLNEGKWLLVDDPLTTSIQFKAYSGLVAARGIAATGRVRINSYTGVAVRGDMAGEIDVDSYAYVHVSGSLTGKLLIRSYATVVIDGDLLGEVEAGSYTTFLLRGRLTGKLTIRTSNSRFWFQQYMTKEVAEALGEKGGSSNDLHLRESDYPVGKHDDVPGWKTVVVGEDAWNVIAR